MRKTSTLQTQNQLSAFFRTSYSSRSPCNLKEINCVISATEELWVDNTDSTINETFSWGYTAFL